MSNDVVHKANGQHRCSKHRPGFTTLHTAVIGSTTTDNSQRFAKIRPGQLVELRAGPVKERRCSTNTHSQTLWTSAKPPPSPLLRLYRVSRPPYRTSGGGGGSKTLRRAAARALGPSMGLRRPGACLSATRVFCESFDEAAKPATLTFEDIPLSTL